MSYPWKNYSSSEVQELTARPQPPTVTVERECPSCRRRSVRFYYHDLAGTSRTIGSAYVWCRYCRKTWVFTGQAFAPEFEFDDPFKNLAFAEFGKVEQQKEWYSKLDELWENGVLPQKATIR